MDQSLALAGAPHNGMSSVSASDPGRPPTVYFGQSRGSRLFGAAGVAFAAYLLTRSIQSAVHIGQVHLGRWLIGAQPGERSGEVYVPWYFAGPMAVWLVFAALSCVALAWPAARAAVFNVHPFGGVCIAFLLFPLTVPFCTSWVGNIAYLPFAALVVVILRRLGNPVPVQRKR